MANFEKWLNDFCIYNFHYSYDALITLSKIDGKVVRILVTAIQDYYKRENQ
jgi:hypothetical protein